MVEKSTSPQLDLLDFKIIKLLNKNARLPATEIAKAAGADVRTIRNRINRLVEKGVVRLAGIVDPASFGYNTCADIFLEVETEKEPELAELFIQKEYVSYMAYGIGSGEISLEVRFKNPAELREFLVREVPSIPGVKQVRYTLVPQILKNINEWLPGEGDFSGSGTEIME